MTSHSQSLAKARGSSTFTPPQAMQTFESSVELPVSIEEAFAYHERSGALNRLIPPWEKVTIESTDGSLRPGSRVTLRTQLAGVPLRWVAEHRAYEPPHRFEDIALSGPFRSWHHQHQFRSLPGDRSELTDHIDYEVPLGTLGNMAGGTFVRNQIEAMFAYRHRVTRDDLTLAAKHRLAPQTIAITGAGGLLGQALMPFLSVLGHQVIAAKRQGSNASTSFTVDANASDLKGGDSKASDSKAGWNGVDTVIHLAGKSIADARWTPEVKEALRSSRVEPTRRLCEQLASLDQRPSTFVCASAIGIYGDRGDEKLDESSPPDDGFLAEIGKQWEAACQPARDAGIRVVNLRLGIILSPKGGALAKMLMPGKLGLGGPMGSGKQWMSWVAMDDVLGAIYHAIATPSVKGPMNVVSPKPCTNAEFAKVLGKALGRPAFVPAPSFALRLALGEMADALLLASTRVEPQTLLSSGYRFRFDDLEESLRYLLGRTGRRVSMGAESLDKRDAKSQAGGEK